MRSTMAAQVFEVVEDARLRLALAYLLHPALNLACQWVGCSLGGVLVGLLRQLATLPP